MSPSKAKPAGCKTGGLTETKGSSMTATIIRAKPPIHKQSDRLKLPASDVREVRKFPPATPGGAATQWTIDALAPLREILPTWPKVFPSAVGDPVLPLKIGIDIDLAEIIGPPPSDAHKTLRGVLRRYTNSSQYRWAVKDQNSWRHALDGTSVEPVAAEHKVAPSQKPQDEAMPVETKAIKVTVSIDAKALKPARTGAPVVLEIKTPGGLTARAHLNPKSYRKAVEVIRTHGPENVVVLLQGRMEAPGEIIGAGISAIERKPVNKIEPKRAEA